MGNTEYVVFTNFAAFRKTEKQSIRNIGSEKRHHFVLTLIFLGELCKMGLFENMTVSV